MSRRSRRRAIAALTVSLVCGLSACGRAERWNVLLVTFDTTRADFLGPYGRESAETPTLDRLAAEGTVFERCYSAAPLTMPSHSTIMTGAYPPRHGVRDNSFFRLPDEAVTLAEVLRDAGYRTGAAVGSFVLDRQFGIGQGFELYDDDVTSGYEDPRGRRVIDKVGVFFDERPAAHVNEAILPWLRAGGSQPFFAWIHYWDPHHPHIPPPPYDHRFSNDLYEGEIANADAALGRVLAELEASGALERTVVVMTADHGEGRGEHQERTHATLCYDATLHVPLIVRLPGGAGGRRVASTVGTVDILPTLLDLLGLPAPEGVQGRSLVPELEGREGPRPGGYYAETLAPALGFGLGELRAWREGGLKYVHGPRPELFDVGEDPRELRDLSAERPQDTADMKARLARFLAAESGVLAVRAAHAADAGTLARLEALGYLSASGVGAETIRETLRDGGVPPQDRVDDIGRLSGAKNALAAGRFAQARELAALLMASDPESEHYRTLMAAAEMGLGNGVEARRLVESVGVPPRGFARLYHALALQVAVDDEDRALELVDRVLAADPSAEGHRLRADLLRRLDRGAEARAALRAALEADPGHVPARLDLGIELAGAGDLEGAGREFRAAVETNPIYPRSHFNYAKLLRDTGRLEEAGRHFARAVELDATYCDAYLGLVDVELARDRTEQAIAAYETLARACPDSEAAAVAFGLLLGS